MNRTTSTQAPPVAELPLVTDNLTTLESHILAEESRHPGATGAFSWILAAVTLSAENFRQLFVPIGFAHGFLVLSERADIEYKCSDIYDPASERGLMWNDPAIGVVRHADAGYELAREVAARNSLDIPAG